MLWINQVAKPSEHINSHTAVFLKPDRLVRFSCPDVCLKFWKDIYKYITSQINFNLIWSDGNQMVGVSSSGRVQVELYPSLRCTGPDTHPHRWRWARWVGHTTLRSVVFVLENRQRSLCSDGPGEGRSDEPPGLCGCLLWHGHCQLQCRWVPKERCLYYHQILITNINL